MKQEKPLNKTHLHIVKKELKEKGLDKVTQRKVLQKLFTPGDLEKPNRSDTKSGHKVKAKRKKAKKQSRRSRKRK